MDYAWTTGNDDELEYVRTVGGGAFGDVHEVSHYFALLLTAS